MLHLRGLHFNRPESPQIRGAFLWALSRENEAQRSLSLRFVALWRLVRYC